MGRDATDNRVWRAEQARRAVDLLREGGDRAHLARALRNLGEIERGFPDRDAAPRHYEKAVAMFRDEGDSLKLAHTIRHLGDIHHDEGRPDLAEARRRYVE